jgi:hypothetical protein
MKPLKWSPTLNDVFLLMLHRTKSWYRGQDFRSANNAGNPRSGAKCAPSPPVRFPLSEVVWQATNAIGGNDEPALPVEQGICLAVVLVIPLRLSNEDDMSKFSDDLAQGMKEAAAFAEGGTTGASVPVVKVPDERAVRGPEPTACDRSFCASRDPW